MIKVNLLNSVTERVSANATSSGAPPDTAKTVDPRMRLMLLAATVGGLTLAAMAFDYFTSSAALRDAQAELERERSIAEQMAAISREQAELDKKTNDTNARRSAIQKLRASQQGPVAVLSAVNQRLPQITDFRLESIEQKAGELVIKGNSPNETAVTDFGRSLERSAGLFTNVNLETQRKFVENAIIVDAGAAASGENASKPAPRPETIGFTIKCRYKFPDAGQPVENAPTTTTATTATTTATAPANHQATVAPQGPGAVTR